MLAVQTTTRKKRIQGTLYYLEFRATTPLLRDSFLRRWSRDSRNRLISLGSSRFGPTLREDPFPGDNNNDRGEQVDVCESEWACNVTQKVARVRQRAQERGHDNTQVHFGEDQEQSKESHAIIQNAPAPLRDRFLPEPCAPTPTTFFLSFNSCLLTSVPLDLRTTNRTATPSNLKSSCNLCRRNRSKNPGIVLTLQNSANVGGRALSYSDK